MNGTACSICGYQQSIIALADVPVGAYIEYTPSNTTVTVLASDSGYTSNQTFATSNYTAGWKVFKNNAGQIDIISAESVGRLYLKGTTGYARAVYTLNKMSNDYVNPEYATSGRSLGYLKGSSEEIIDATTYPITWENTYTNGNKGFPYKDTYYTGDLSIINTEVDGTYPLLHTSGAVRLASRNLAAYSSYSLFLVRNLASDGTIGGTRTHYATSASSSPESYSGGVRPIISLKSGLKIVGGEGTSANPYVISF